MKFSTIPPFKIFFTVPMSNKEISKKRKNISAVKLTWHKIKKLKDVYDELKGNKE